MNYVLCTDKKIPEAVLRRLPRYYRCLNAFENQNILKVSSVLLSEQLAITASQVRQDLSNFGEFGQKGFGYEVKKLKSEIAAILNIDKPQNMIIIGGGNIGQALANYSGFVNVKVTAVFDINSDKIAVKKNIKVLNVDKLEDFIGKNQVDICAIAVNTEAANAVCKRAALCGIKAFWNFAPVELNVSGGVVIENVNMSDSLYVLSYKLKQL